MSARVLGESSVAIGLPLTRPVADRDIHYRTGQILQQVINEDDHGRNRPGTSAIADAGRLGDPVAARQLQKLVQRKLSLDLNGSDDAKLFRYTTRR